MNLVLDFSTLGGVAAINVAVTEVIVKYCKVTKNWVKQLISWCMPIVLSIVGLLCQLGLFADYGTIEDWKAWIFTLLTGLGVGLISNGLYDIQGVQKFLDWIRSLFKKKTEKDVIDTVVDVDKIKSPEAPYPITQDTESVPTDVTKKTRKTKKKEA